MSDRSIRVILRAEVAGYRQAMDEAAKATKAVGDGLDTNSKEGKKALAYMQDAARQQREVWQKVGTTLTAVGGSVLAVGVAALKTGIQYNTLQQTTRAALTTILGSAEAANEQMDRLDAFARTSPFAKQTFITAQQQMLAFGIETKKVIPYLDAMQNAVAASGGSNQQLEEVAFVISQIGAAGKITATDLMQLGQRGINAAELIGSQMGMTGAEIRASITKGTLGATEALDALAAGMQERYAGAADGVKNTFAGAMDRVKGAWRDFGAELAKPLVDPNGGGALVDLLNWTADIARGFLGLPEPVKKATTAIVFTGAAAVTAAGGFLVLFPRIIDTYGAFKRLSTDMPRVASGLKGVGKAAGVAGAALAVLQVGGMLSGLLAGETKGVDAATAALLRMGDAGSTALDDLFQVSGWRRAFTNVNNLSDAIDRVVSPGVIDRLDDFAGSIMFQGGGSELNRVRQQFEEIGDALGSMVSGGRAEQAASMFEDLSAQWVAAGGSVADLKKLLPGYTTALTAAANEQELAGSSAEGAAGGIDMLTVATQEQEQAAKEAQQAIDDYVASLESAASKVGSSTDVWSSLWSDAESAADDATESADRTGEAWKKAFTPPSMDDWVKALQEQAEAFANFSGNVLTATSQLKTELPADLQSAVQPFTQWLMEQGPEAVATFVNANKDQREDLVRAWAGTGDQMADTLAAEVYGKTISFVVTADGASALMTAQEVRENIDGSSGTVTVYGYTGPVERSLEGATAEIDEASGTVTIKGDDARANTTLSNFKIKTDSTTGTTTITGNDSQGRQVVVDLKQWVGTQSATLNISANTQAALNSFSLLKSTITGTTVGVGTVLRPGGATGMRLPGFPTGGRLPGQPPANRSIDNLLGVDERGMPQVRVRSREWVVNEQASDYYGDRLMAAINSQSIPREALAGVAAQAPALVGGGSVGSVTASLDSGALTSALDGARLTLVTDVGEFGATVRTQAVSAVAGGLTSEQRGQNRGGRYRW